MFGYRLDRAAFAPWPEEYGQWVAHTAIEPLSVEPVGDLIERHATAGVELRFVSDLWPFWDEVVVSGLPFGGVRLANAAPSRSGRG